MKILFNLSGFLVMALFLLACHDGREVESPETSIDHEKQAIQMVMDFKYESGMSRSEQPSIKIKSVKKETTLARSSSDIASSVDLYHVEFESSRGDGFAMVASDDKLSSMLCYVPEGALEDTCYIEPMAEMIRNMRDVISERLQAKDSMLSRGVNWQYTEIGPLLKTMWHQRSPYNNACPMKNCSGNNGRALVGCGGLATAMIIAYCPTSEALARWPNLREYSKIAHLSASDPLAPEIARFIRDVADGCSSDYGCSSTGTGIGHRNKFLNSIGYEDKKIYKSSNNINIANFLGGIRWNKPTQARGDQRRHKDGHTWVIDGFRGWRSPSWTSVYSPEDHLFHCNWGWGSDYGWYASCLTPNAQTSSYHYENSFIYFNWPF